MRIVFPVLIMAATLSTGSANAQGVSADLSAKCSALVEASRHGQPLPHATEKDRTLLTQCQDALATSVPPSSDT